MNGIQGGRHERQVAPLPQSSDERVNEHGNDRVREDVIGVDPSGRVLAEQGTIDGQGQNGQGPVQLGVREFFAPIVGGEEGFQVPRPVQARVCRDNADVIVNVVVHVRVGEYRHCEHEHRGREHHVALPPRHGNNLPTGGALGQASSSVGNGAHPFNQGGVARDILHEKRGVLEGDTRQPPRRQEREDRR